MKQTGRLIHMYSGKITGPPKNDESIVRYLFREMAEEELTAMEQRIENDTSVFELVASVEDDLIMQYVRGTMDQDFRLRFEKVYLTTPERRARIEAARTLRAAVREVAVARHRQHPKLSFLASAKMQIVLAVLLVAMGFTTWIWWRSGSFVTKPDATPTQISLTLEPGRNRSGSVEPGVKQFVLSPGIREVRFYLRVPEFKDYESYQVIVGTPERPGIFRGPAKLQGATMSVVVPANLLTVGDYTLELQGVVPYSSPQPIATYYFRSAS